VPVRRFQDAAEKYGYVIVGSNNSRNGPIKVATVAFEAMWNDTHARLAIDNGQVYATGFSGGARVANFVATLCENCVAGVISCGAGFNQAYPPTRQTSFAVFATVGVDDFNYPELVELNATLEKYSIPHRVATFDGSHSWPPAELCAEAIEWMEIRAIKTGRRAKNEALIHELFGQALKRARALEEQKKGYEALASYQSLIMNFKGLEETGDVERRVAELKASKEITERAKEEKAEVEKQRALTNELLGFARTARDPDQRFHALGDLRVRAAELRKKAEAADDTSERRVARRSLRQVYAQFYEAATIGSANDRQAAKAQLEIAAEVAPHDPSIFYQFAILYAQDGEKRRALEALRSAVDYGLKDVSLIEGHKEFDRLREEVEYRKIIDKLKTK
jgi:hypothetical protein